MDYKSAVDKRTSRRKFIPKPLSPVHEEELRLFIDECNEASGLSTRLMVGSGGAFAGIGKSYGMFSGVENYIALVGDFDDQHRLEKEGYFGEKIVLKATDMGLATCWVAGTYDKNWCAGEMPNNLKPDCVIAIGYAEKEPSRREKFIKGIIHRKTKSLEQLLKSDETDTPTWVIEGIKGVQKAPSAMNLQPVLFEYDRGVVIATVKKPFGTTLIDLGIAKLHFEIGAGKGRWQWGSRGEYDVEESWKTR